MSLLWGWALVAVVGAVAGAVGAAWWRTRRRPPARDALWVANSAFVAQVPEVRRLLRVHRTLVTAAVVALAGAVAAAGVLVARPHETTVASARLATRDIVLCLDVSGSMAEPDARVLGVFEELVTRFSGERVALVVWDSSSHVVFPLSDDYVMVRDQIAETRAALEANAEWFDDPQRDLVRGDPADDALARLLAATGAGDRGASLVGDGLARCALTFDLQETERSRSIVLATDNEVAGDPLYTLAQAADLAAARDIHLYGLDPGTGYEADELRTVLESRGGLYVAVDDPAAVPALVEDVLRQQAVELDADPPVVVTDTPGPAYLVLLAAVGALLVAAWRARE